MKRMYLILAAVLFTTLATTRIYSQDIIVTTKGTKVEAKILEIGLETVKYKEFSDQQGPDYVIKKNEIVSIIYENGNVVVFYEEKQTNNVQQTTVTQEDALTQEQMDRLLFDEHRYFRSLRGKEMLNYLKENDLESYRMFNTGRNMKIAGIVVMLVIGGPSTAIGMADLSVAYGSRWMGVALLLSGGLSGVPLLVTGVKLQKKAKDNYAKKYLNRSKVYVPSFNLDINGNSVGVTLNF